MKLKYYLRGLGIGIIVTAILMGVTLSAKNKPSDEEVKSRALELGMIEGTTLTEGYSTVNISPEPIENDHPNIIVPSQMPSGDLPVKTLEITPEGAINLSAGDVADESDAANAEDEKLPEQAETGNSDDEMSGDNTMGESAGDIADSTESDSNDAADEGDGAASDDNAANAGDLDDSADAADEQSDVSVNQNVGDGKIYKVSVNRGDSSGSVCKRMESDGLIESARDFDRYLCQKGYDTKLSFGEYSLTKDLSYEQMAQILMGH